MRARIRRRLRKLGKSGPSLCNAWVDVSAMKLDECSTNALVGGDAAVLMESAMYIVSVLHDLGDASNVRGRLYALRPAWWETEAMTRRREQTGVDGTFDRRGRNIASS